jgi:CheY-like chemotaxis protein
MERLGCLVHRAEDGDELLQAIADGGPFDLIVTDVSMPWMTGLQVAHSARTAGVTTPVIVMTASVIPPTDVEQIGGSTVLLRKPFRLSQLTRAVCQLLRGLDDRQ